MCGIAGIVYLDGSPPHARLVSSMLDRLVHRGPDSGGIAADDGQALTRSPHGRDGAATRQSFAQARSGPTAVLGHRRLAITDLSDRADQPMASLDGRYVISFNGAVYNARELRGQLEQEGFRFRSTSDTEVVLNALVLWGQAALDRFDGMWAIALWDTHARSLFCARDRLGEKGLYYRLDGHRLAFASEPKALRPVAPAEAEMDVVQRFLSYGIVPGDDETAFRGVSMLPAGCTLVGASGGISIRRYYDLDSAAARLTPPARFASAADQVRELLAASIERRLRADVPVGACLSGGLDSSAIAMLASRSPRAPQPLVSLSARYPNRPDIDESDYASIVARAAATSARFVEPDEDAFDRELDAHVASMDDLFPHSGSYAQRVVYQDARDAGLKVVLSGQGADELFGGYEPWGVFLHSLRRQGRTGAALVEGFLSGRRQGGLRRGARRAAGVAGRALRDRLLPGAMALSSLPFPSWIGDRVHDESSSALVRQQPESLHEYLGQLLLRDHLPGLLRFEDRNSMAAGVEARLPFLEVGLVQLARSLPDHMLLRSGWTKAVLREALRGVVPEPVRLRKSKLGFPGPIEASTRDRSQLVLPAWSRLASAGWVHGEFPAQPSSPAGRALGLRIRVLDSFVRVCLDRA